MRLVVLSSGSKGNTAYLETNNLKILIDAGNNTKYITEKLSDINVDLSDINFIIITHTHTDHIGGLQILLKRKSIDVYLTKNMLKDLPFLTKYNLINDYTLDIEDLHIDIIKTSHDTESLGFIFTSNKKSIVYLTDTGYINNRYHNLLSNKEIYYIESNHDVEMLLNGKYPRPLKQRILSDKGHLSNEQASIYLSEFIGNKTKQIILGHLSEENNTEFLALSTLTEKLALYNKQIKDITISKQNEVSKEIII